MTPNIPSVPPQVARVNPWPKWRFLESPDNIRKHREMVDGREFQRAVDFALLETAVRLGTSITDAQSAMAVGMQLKGAVDFLSTVRMLSEMAPAIPKPPLSENLDHDQK